VTRANELASLQSAVLDWYAANGRDLAFRRTRDPWAVLVSEVIAQQTQAARAAEAWERFIAQFPTPAALAAVSPATVIRAWRGLGYNRRAIALREAATRIVEDHGGRVPETLEALTALPGVGPYTARAVLAFAFDRPVAPLDTNIRRVLDRAIGPLPAAPKALQATADGFVPPNAAADWAHALMDLGATICVARAPRCDACPIRVTCRSLRTGSQVTFDRARSRPKVGARSTPFPDTSRWLRGRILDRLRDAADDAWVVFDAPIGTHPHDAVIAEVGRLSNEGLLEADAMIQGARLTHITLTER
jgi:A/G-specific adenine glycosylase